MIVNKAEVSPTPRGVIVTRLYAKLLTFSATASVLWLVGNGRGETMISSIAASNLVLFAHARELRR